MENKEIVSYNLKHLQNLVFEVTDKCNLNCKYCGYSTLYEGYDNREGIVLPFHKAKLIIDYIFSIRDNSPDAIFPLTISFYGGEPLLNFNFIKQIVEYVKIVPFSQKKVRFGMTTNAMLLNKYMDFLVENEFNLLISLDGDEKGQSYRVDHSGRNSFKRVFINVKLLEANYPEYFQKFVNFNSVLHNRNEVETIYRFIYDNFKKSPSIASLNTTGVRKEMITDFRTMFQNAHRSIMNSKNCESVEAELFIRAPRVLNLAKYIIKCSGNVYIEYNDLLFDIAKKINSFTGTCSPFSKKMFITVNGKILQCERIDHKYSLGQIFDDHFDLNLESISQKQNQYISKLQKQCEKCYLKNDCPICIYNIESLSDSNPRCPGFCNKGNYQKREKSIFDYLKDHPDYYEKIFNDVLIKG